MNLKKLDAMNDYLNILLLALMPAAGNFVGGLGAEFFKVSPKMLSFALHLAAGIVLAVVGVELMPSALQAAKPWIVIAAFVLGGVFFTVMDKSIDYVQTRFGKGKASTSAWSIYFAVSIDLFSDGIMIGSGSAIAASLGLLLALGQIPADLPEGFATIATLKKLGVARGTPILLAASFTIPIVLGASISYFAVRDSDELYEKMQSDGEMNMKGSNSMVRSCMAMMDNPEMMSMMIDNPRMMSMMMDNMMMRCEEDSAMCMMMRDKMMGSKNMRGMMQNRMKADMGKDNP